MNSFKNLAKELISSGLPVVYYGAGESASFFIKVLREHGVEPVLICDSNLDKQGGNVLGIKIASLNDCLQKFPEFSVLITVLTQGAKQEIGKILAEAGIPEKRIFQCDLADPEEIRQACARFHLTSMDDYFKNAEAPCALEYFWGKNTPFYQMFQKLDLTNVIELACGKGRHVQKYIDFAKQIILVDILKENIDYCENRFSQYEKVNYLVNNGTDFKPLPSNAYTALFTYDAMIHFESIDVYYYLKDTYRILKPGGRALFHHSNNTADYTQSFTNNIYLGRSYMSAQLFAHYAHRAGLIILEQKLIDYKIKELDCLSLVEKPLEKLQ